MRLAQLTHTRTGDSRAMIESVMYFILHESEPLAALMEALLAYGALEVEERDSVTVARRDRQWAALNVTTRDEYDMRRLIALCLGFLEPDEQDPRVIGAALASAGEWMLGGLRPEA